MAKRFNILRENTTVISAGLMLIFSLSMAFQYFWNTMPDTTKKASFNEAAALVPDFSDATTRLSRSEITSQIERLTKQIDTMETAEAVRGPLGTIIYSPETTGRLAHDYQQIELRTDYLAKGRVTDKETVHDITWGEYVLKPGSNRPFTVAEIEKTLQVLEEYPWTSNVLTGFRIFALPDTIPDVSGLGGAGFSMLSAAGDRNDSQDSLDEQLRVTLYHEIGHHLHLSVMPDNTAAGNRLWQEYLTLRGGTWHGPGKVKTAAWSNSSEEMFAEDFRMLFGKDQPYYGDVSLGDLRTDPSRAAEVRHFMADLAKKPVAPIYQSPWTPEGARFWIDQPLVIAGAWALLGGCVMIIVVQQAGRRRGAILHSDSTIIQ